MGFFDEFAKAVSSYPADSVALDFVDYGKVTGTPGEINVNEVWLFKIKVTNKGNLDLLNVKVRVESLSGASLCPNLEGPWVNSIVISNPVLNIPASDKAIKPWPFPIGSSRESGGFLFKAPSVSSQSPIDLMKVTIAGFDASLEHILKDHSGSSAVPTKVYSRQVYP